MSSRRALDDARLRKFVSFLCAALEEASSSSPCDGDRSSAFLSFADRYASPAALLEAIAAELCASGEAARRRPVRAGASRLLARWIEFRYARDAPKDRALRLRLFGLVASLPPASEERSRPQTELLRALSRGGKRKREPEPPPPATRLGPDPAPTLRSAAPPTRLFDHPRDRIARRLSELDAQAFRAVQRRDLARGGPTLSALVDRSNRLSAWVASVALVQRSPAAIGRAVSLWLHVAYRCADAGDLFGARSIWVGLESGPVARLRRHVRVEPKLRPLLRWLSAKFSVANNEADYRALVDERLADGQPCVPYPSLWQRDLTIVDDGNPDLTPAGDVNVDKLALVCAALDRFERMRASCAELAAGSGAGTPELDAQLRALRGLPEDELERLSGLVRPYAASASDDHESSGSSTSANNAWQFDAASADSSSSADDGELITPSDHERLLRGSPGRPAGGRAVAASP